jgi:hypothetical protein
MGLQKKPARRGRFSILGEEIAARVDSVKALAAEKGSRYLVSKDVVDFFSADVAAMEKELIGLPDAQPAGPVKSKVDFDIPFELQERIAELRELAKRKGLQYNANQRVVEFLERRLVDIENELRGM